MVPKVIPSGRSLQMLSSMRGSHAMCSFLSPGVVLAQFVNIEVLQQQESFEHGAKNMGYILSVCLADLLSHAVPTEHTELPLLYHIKPC